MVVVIVQNKGILLHYRLDDQSNAFRQRIWSFYFFIFYFWLLFLRTKRCLFDGGLNFNNFCHLISGVNAIKMSQNTYFEATTSKNSHLTVLNAGIRWEKNIYFWQHLYHHVHGDRLILASYVLPKINHYKYLWNIHFSTSKSGLVGAPTHTSFM